MPDLLINGPIESIGISGAEAHIEKRRFPKDAIKSFNAIDNVINIVKKNHTKFNKIIWNITDKNSYELEEIYIKSGLSEIDIELVSRPNNDDSSIYHPRWSNHPLAENNSVKYIKNLIYLLSLSDSNNIMIMRSDQFIDINLIDFNKYSQYIRVPRIKKSFIEAGDTYIVSNRKLLLSKLEFAQSNNRGLDDNIHRIFWKSQAYVNKDLFKIPLIFFKLPYPYNVGVWSKKIAEYIQSDFLRPMSFEVYKSVEWRGSKYSSKHLNDMKENYLFEENYQPNVYIKPPLFKIYIKDIYMLIKSSLINIFNNKNNNY